MRHIGKLSSILALGWLLCCLPVSAQTRLATASLHQETKPARLSKDQKGLQATLNPETKIKLLSFRKLTEQDIRSQAKSDNIETILNEDFSLFTAGSEDAPDTTPIVSDYVLDENLTHEPGYTGGDIYQAGGVCLLGKEGYFWGGYINTPVKEYTGIITLTFKAKAVYNNKSNVMISFIDDPWANFPVSVTEIDYYSLDMDSSDGWQNYEYVFLVDYLGTCALQFNTYDAIMLDDIVLTRPAEWIATPDTKPADQFTLNGFRANWHPVPNADEYILNLYKEQPLSNQDASIIADFEDGQLPNGFSVSDGWEIVDGEGVDGSKALCLDMEGDSILLPFNGGRYTSLKFHYKYVPDSSYFTSEFGFYFHNGDAWSSGGSFYDLSCDYELDYETFEVTYDSISENNAQPIPDNLTDAYECYQVYFKLRNMDGPAKLYIDNIEIETTPPTEKVMMEEDLTVKDTFFVFEGMDDATAEYYYTVTGRNSTMTGSESNRVHAFGVAAPTATAATDIDTNGPFTANWQSVPKAATYAANLYRMETLGKDAPAWVILQDDFSKVESEAAPDAAETLGNTETSYLDEYTAVPGWTGFDNIIANGMLGFTEYGEMLTPLLDLSNNGGKYRITITAQCPWGLEYGETLAVQGNTQYGIIDFNTNDTVTATFEFSDGTEATSIYLYNLYGMDVLIDEITIEQDLVAGDEVFTPVAIHENLAADVLSYRFEDFDRPDPNATYAYRVFATYDKWGNFYQGMPSEPVVINYPVDTTLPECPMPTNLRVEDITTNSARLLWDADQENTSFNLRYRKADAQNWTNASELHENQHEITNLESNTAYVWTVMAACSEGRYSGWATENEFTTQDVANESLDKAGLFVTTGENRINVMNPSALNIDRVRVYTLSGSLAHDFAIRSNGNVLLTIGLSMQVAVVEVLADGQVFRFKVMLP